MRIVDKSLKFIYSLIHINIFIYRKTFICNFQSSLGVGKSGKIIIDGIL